MFIIIVIHYFPLVRFFSSLFVAEPFLLASTPTGFGLPLTFEFPRLLRVAVFGLMTEPFADAALGLAKEPTVFSLMVPQTALATTFSIEDATRKRRLRSGGLVDSLLFFKLPRTSQSSHILLLEYPDEFLGRGVYLRVAIVALLDTYIRPRKIIPGRR